MDQPYLQGTFTLKMCASKVNMSERMTSATIRKVKGMNYNTYINSLRIHYFIESLQKDAKWMDYSVESISYSVGFNSPNSFYQAFKQLTGETPREYMDRFAKTGGEMEEAGRAYV